MNVHSGVYCVSELRAPWGFRVEDSAAAKFHVPLEGRCVLTLDTGERLRLETAELVVLPFGTGHTVRDRARPGEVPSLFVARFRALVGQPPMRFLTRVRLSRAAGSLGTSHATLYAIARRAGYETEASFSKAFKRQFGVAPGAYRRLSVERPIVVERESPAAEA